jgi:hypothetical protein
MPIDKDDHIFFEIALKWQSGTFIVINWLHGVKYFVVQFTEIAFERMSDNMNINLM